MAHFVASSLTLSTYTVHRHHRQTCAHMDTSTRTVDHKVTSELQDRLQQLALQAHTFTENLLDHLVESAIPAACPRFADNFVDAYEANFGQSVVDAWNVSSRSGCEIVHAPPIFSVYCGLDNIPAPQPQPEQDQQTASAHCSNAMMLLCARTTYIRGAGAGRAGSSSSPQTLAEYSIIGVSKSSLQLAADVDMLCGRLEGVLHLIDDNKLSSAAVLLAEAEAAWEEATCLPVVGEAFYCLPIENDTFPPWAAAWGRPFPTLSSDYDGHSAEVDVAWANYANCSSTRVQQQSALQLHQQSVDTRPKLTTVLESDSESESESEDGNDDDADSRSNASAESAPAAALEGMDGQVARMIDLDAALLYYQQKIAHENPKAQVVEQEQTNTNQVRPEDGGGGNNRSAAHSASHDELDGDSSDTRAINNNDHDRDRSGDDNWHHQHAIIDLDRLGMPIHREAFTQDLDTAIKSTSRVARAVSFFEIQLQPSIAAHSSRV